MTDNKPRIDPVTGRPVFGSVLEMLRAIADRKIVKKFQKMLGKKKRKK